MTSPSQVPAAPPAAVPLHEAAIEAGPLAQAAPACELLPPQGEPVVALPPELRGLLAINVIHDGRVIPPAYLTRDGRPVDPAEVQDLYVRERDWGASLVAAELAGALGIGGYLHVHLARALMDFGRFPGLTPAHATYMERLAVNSPFAQWLDFEQKWRLLEEGYDAISDQADRELSRKVLTIGVHTYDPVNASGTPRPQVSVLNRAMSYQQSGRMPQGLFDPLFPDLLGEATCDRVLPGRISLHLEQAGVPVAINFPYTLPEGSVEVRSQVWHFFDHVRDRMHERHPGVAEDPIYDLVWDMLLDTNLRSSESQALRSYLHGFRTPPRGRKREFAYARRAYEHIGGLVRQDGGALVRDWSFARGRPGAIGIEVRKDLVWAFDPQGRPLHPKPEAARRLGRLLAQAIGQYLLLDRAGDAGATA